MNHIKNFKSESCRFFQEETEYILIRIIYPFITSFHPSSLSLRNKLTLKIYKN